ncbi:MAG: hydrogenase maturation nickel metallochaperone HypA [Candidatus Eremiobacteraeota bacterium]|nr:hydrogenase maturation nickel metallochaperone HypA [Candidatus Eremiobacteraeota bacterium]
MSLLEGVTEEAAKQRIGRVSAVHVRLGAMSGVVRDALAFSWELAAADTVAAGSRLVIEEIPLAVF